MRARVSLIAAVARNGVIGCQGDLPWHIPEDLKRFRALTMGHAVIMGRRTWESIGRPLPGRRMIVVSRQPGLTVPGAEVAASLPEALAFAEGDEDLFVIGGGEIYAQAMALADRLMLTEVDISPAGDAFFPAVDTAAWHEVWRSEPRRAPDGTGYAFVDLVRATPAR